MSLSDWDVEKHKVEHECDEHWELRRNFLETHKEKFPEDQLVCLAQVFTNVELLGCRYPQETMDTIAELSQDVAKDYRERQKMKLQRTFVKASDAASSKVKGLKPPTGDTGRANSGESSKQMKFISEDERSCKRMKIDNAPYGQLILMQRPDESPIGVIQSAAASCGIKFESKLEKIGNAYNCKVFLNTVKLSEASDTNAKKSKATAFLEGLSTLQKHYYTIKVKKLVRKADCDKNQLMGDNDEAQAAISSDNVGNKMMKMMGWTGGGLGKKQQGITEPVTVQTQLSRVGFGLQSNSSDLKAFHNKVRDSLKNYMNAGTKTDLVFAPEFTSEERAVIHKVAQTLGLKASSSGPKDKRTLVISRKFSPRFLLNELLEVGGSNEKYELIEPTEP